VKSHLSLIVMRFQCGVKVLCLLDAVCVQVLRYDRGGRPLWVTDHNILYDSTSVPCCEKCGAPRHFEFQVRDSSVL